MQLRRSAAALALILRAVTAVAAPPEDGLATNAEGGTFPSARTFWFSVGPRERVRLVLDGQELYRGPGPAVAELPAAEGEERHYGLVAERLSPAPDDSLLESRSFLVVVDAAPPEPPVLTAAFAAEDGWSVSVSAEPRTRVAAVVSADGAASFLRDLADGTRIDGRDLSILAWTVDAAGNSSEPAAFSWKPFGIVLANPAPGRWANRQRLVVSSDGAEAVFWTDDGSDPLGPRGRPYGGPVLIDRTGDVVVKVAARSNDGRVERREAAYSVAEKDSSALAALEESEARPVTAERTVAVPEGFRWDAATALRAEPSSAELRYEGGADVALRPVRGVSRAVPILVGDTGDPWRYCFLLDGLAGAEAAARPPAGETTPADPPGAPSEGDPAMYASGSARALLWGRSGGPVRYRILGSSSWADATGPVPLPGTATVVEWIVEGDSGGPYSLTVPAAPGVPDGLAPAASVPGGSVQPGAVTLSSADGRRSAPFGLRVSGYSRGPNLSIEPSGRLDLDVCDGEELLWSMSPAVGGRALSWTIDRAPPRSPRIDGPAEGAWLSRGTEISVSGEGTVRATAVLVDAKGSVERRPFDGALRLEPTREGPVSVRVEAISEDEAGNASRAAVRSFTLDASTIFAGTERGDGSGEADGSRARPFETLDEAVAAAESASLKRIRVIGSARLLGVVALGDGLLIEGGFRADGSAFGGQSLIVAAAGAALTVEGGASVSMASLSIRGDPASPVPLVRAGPRAKFEAASCDFAGGGSAVESDRAVVSLTDCRVVAAGRGAERAVGVAARGSTLELERCRIEVLSASSVAVALESRGGSLSLRSVLAEARSAGSALAIAVRSSTVIAEGSDAVAVAGTYASAFDAQEVYFTWKDGILSAAGNDAALVTLEDCDGAFSGASFRVAAASTARGLRVRGAFPSVRDSGFYSSPSARSSDVFSGAEPAPGNVTGNRFEGFKQIWADRYAAEDIASFNRRFASGGSPNAVVDEDAE